MSKTDFLHAIQFAKDLKHLDGQIEALLLDDNRRLTVDVYFDEDVDKWVVCDQMCSLGGCYIGGDEFETEAAALREAAIRTLIGDKMLADIPCGECYREYLQQCE